MDSTGTSAPTSTDKGSAADRSMAAFLAALSVPASAATAVCTGLFFPAIVLALASLGGGGDFGDVDLCDRDALVGRPSSVVSGVFKDFRFLRPLSQNEHF
jgi:hypothetical protein